MLKKTLRLIRARNDETGYQMAKRLGIPQSSLSNYENKKLPISVKFLDKIKKAYELTPEEIITLELEVHLSKKEIKIPLKNATALDVRLINTFKDNYTKFSDKEKEKLIELFER